MGSKATERPRRSWLLGLILDDKRLQKAVESCADVITLDLEDAVTPENKAKARERVVEIIRAGRQSIGGREIWVRVNDLFSPWGREDIEAVIGLDIDGLVYPSVRGAEEVWTVRRKMVERGCEAQLKLILETPQAFMNIREIVTVPGVTSLTHGSGDLSVETGMSLGDRVGFGVTATQTVLAARACGLSVTEGIHMEDWRNEDAVRAYVTHAKAQGFDGLHSFYLPNMAIINEVFTPTEQEVAAAKRVIEAYETGRREGRPAVVVDGKAVLIHQYLKARNVVQNMEAVSPG